MGRKSIHNHNIEPTATHLSRHGLAELLATAHSSADSLVDHLLKTSSLEALDGSVSGTVGAGNVAAKLLGLLRRRNKHASGTETSLCGETCSLLDGEALRNSAGDEVLDHHEEVGRAGSCEEIVLVAQSIHMNRTHPTLLLTRNTSNNIQQPLLANPLSSLAHTRHQRTRQLPLIL